MGMGKSGHMGIKLPPPLPVPAPCFLVHPGGSSHGDLGMVTEKDIVLAISDSV